MRQGIIGVRNALGTGVRIGDRDIEDALWHYYYDVEKSVNYLLSKYECKERGEMRAFIINVLKIRKPKDSTGIRAKTTNPRKYRPLPVSLTLLTRGFLFYMHTFVFLHPTLENTVTFSLLVCCSHTSFNIAR